MHDEHAIRDEPGYANLIRVTPPVLARIRPAGPGTRRALRQLASAIHDEHVAGVLAEFTASAARPGEPGSSGVADGDLAARLIAAGQAGPGLPGVGSR